MGLFVWNGWIETQTLINFTWFVKEHRRADSVHFFRDEWKCKQTRKRYKCITTERSISKVETHLINTFGINSLNFEAYSNLVFEAGNTEVEQVQQAIELGDRQVSEPFLKHHLIGILQYPQQTDEQTTTGLSWERAMLTGGLENKVYRF